MEQGITTTMKTTLPYVTYVANTIKVRGSYSNTTEQATVSGAVEVDVGILWINHSNYLTFARIRGILYRYNRDQLYKHSPIRANRR
jgi:hypothetical protein